MSPKKRPMRHARRSVLAAISGLLAASAVHGQSGVVLHEYIPPDVAEDLALGALTSSGKMPAVLRTPSGLVSAPDKLRSAVEGQTPSYSTLANKSANRFQIDGTTSDPGTLHYHEPFRPSIAPFKRLYTFDAVNEAFELYLRNPARHVVSLAGSPDAGDDEFFADLTIAGGQLVRIPSVASGMHVLATDLEPNVPFQLLVDTGDNWFFQAPSLVGKGRLIMRLAAPRAAMSPEFAASSYAALAPTLPEVPASVRRAAEPILAHIGVSRAVSPTQAMRTMIAYFRSFLPSQEHIEEASSSALYQQLTLSQKGVCRHRAYAFVVTSLVLGIPARFVHNEAHAWVEVFDGQLWHRVDLGGAASGFHYDGDKPEGPAYRMPKDNYDWPSHAQPGEQLSARPTGTESESTAADSSENSQGNSPSNAPRPPNQANANNASPVNDPKSSVPVPESLPVPEPLAQPATASSVPENRGISQLTFKVVGNANVHRGEALTVEGNAHSDGGPCGLTRIDLELKRDKERYRLGSTATDDKGHFSMQATVPLRLGVGPYELTAVSGDSAACRASAR
jgi:hypothetical protein